MPELPEVEAYRRAAERSLGREISRVDAPDAWYLKRGLDASAVTDVLIGRRFVGARRRGKLLLLDTSDGAVLGLRFGMTGRLIVDGVAGVDKLLHSSDDARAAWDRFAVAFADGGALTMRDPRRLGGVSLDPDESRLGPDVLDVTPRELRAALVGSTTALKARLMDQARLAGLGNLLTDELLWRAGLSPVRAAGSLSAAELKRLHRHLGAGLTDMIERGGSHTGDLMASRVRGGHCPKDGAPLARDTVGGRTTWWCPVHQH